MKNSNLKFGLIVALLLVTNFSFSQLDSATVDLEFLELTEVDVNGDTITAPYFEATVWVNDMDFFGEVFDDLLDYPVSKAKYSKAQLTDQGLITGLEFKIPIYNIEAGRIYRFVTFVRDYQGNNLPMNEQTQSAD